MSDSSPATGSPALSSGLHTAPATQSAVLDCPTISNGTEVMESKQLCSSCSRNRPISEFSFRLDNGLRKKTCIRHDRKRTLALAQGFADWSIFCESLKLWKLQDDHKSHETKLAFSFESLPALIGSHSERGLVVEDSSMQKWFDGLALKIWQLGGYRFSRDQFYRNKDGTFAGRYLCCQDQADENPAPKKKIRLSRRMRRYACGSLLTFKASLEERILILTLRHKHHAAYKDIGFAPVSDVGTSTLALVSNGEGSSGGEAGDVGGSGSCCLKDCSHGEDYSDGESSCDGDSCCELRSSYDWEDNCSENDATDSVWIQEMAQDPIELESARNFYKAKLPRLISMLEHQDAAGSFKFLVGVSKRLQHPLRFMDDIERMGRQRTMPLTWDTKRDPLC